MDFAQYATFAFALLFVLALIMATAWLLRRMGFGHAMPGPARQRRLSVAEVMPLDAKRRLVLVRRDDVEHLILLGAAGDVVVESGIRAGFRDAVAAAVKAADPAPDGPAPDEAAP